MKIGLYMTENNIICIFYDLEHYFMDGHYTASKLNLNK